MPHFTSKQRTVITGDVTVLVLLTVVGFATHLTLDAFGRMIVTMIGTVAAWAAVAPFLGVYSESGIEDPRSLWRVAWAGVLAAPLATFLRGMMLDRDIPWVFVVVTMLTTSFALVAWRVGYGWWSARRS